MTLTDHARRRRAVRTRRQETSATRALLDAAADFRGRAQCEIRAGHPELAEPWLAEAHLFESAARPA